MKLTSLKQDSRLTMEVRKRLLTPDPNQLQVNLTAVQAPPPSATPSPVPPLKETTSGNIKNMSDFYLVVVLGLYIIVTIL